MLGLDDNEESDLPQEYKQGLYYPDELKNGEIDSFSMRDLYNIHLGKKMNNNNEVKQQQHETTMTTTSFFNASTTMTTIRVMDDISGDEKQSSDGNNNNDDNDYYQLVFDIKHCIFKAGNDTKLLFSIFDDTDKKIITEEYCLHLSENNFPKVGSPEDCKVLFKNLSSELLSHDIYITCRIYRIGPMEAPDVMNHNTKNNKKKNQKINSNEEGIVRPYAATVIRLKDHISKLLSNLGEEIKFEPGTAPICCPKEESTFVKLTFDLISENKNTHYIAPLSIGIAHGLILYRGDINCVEKNYQFYDKLTEIETLSIDPSFHNEKHILYVTIHDIHVNQRNKRAACNVCIKMQLRDNESPYKPILGSMMLGKGKMAIPTTETISPVYYHNNDPIINQTYQILIPSNITKLSNCHLYFTLWHIPATNKKPDERGFAYIKLYHNKLKQLTGNNEYELPLYRHDKKSVNNYLDCDTLKSENKSIRIFFKLSSTKIYSNIDIHIFLTWKQHDINKVISAIKRCARQPFVNLLTILDELMKNIFMIFLESDNQLLIEQTFATLIGILGEANKGTTIKYKPRIESWIELHFKYSKIWRILSIQQLRLLQWIASSDAISATKKDANTTLKQQSAEMIRQLQNMMRGIKYLFNIMRRSSQIECNQNPTKRDIISQEYNKQINQLFNCMNRVMSLKQPKTVAGVQSFALRNFLDLLDSVPTQTSTTLTQTVVKFINSIHNQGINNSVEKLLLIRRCLEHPKLERKDIVNILLPSICNILNHHMNESKDERAACATVMQKCIQFLDPLKPRSVLYSNSKYPVILPIDKKLIYPSQSLLDQFAILMLKMFGILDEIRNNDLYDLLSVQKIFGKQIEKNKKIIDNDNKLKTKIIISNDQLLAHRDFFITIADLSRVLSANQSLNQQHQEHQQQEEEDDDNDDDDDDIITSWGDKCDRIDKAITTLRSENEQDAVRVIESALLCCNNILKKSTFPHQWIIMRMVESEVAMRALSWFGSTLKRNYLSKSFDSGRNLWKQWLELGMIFLSNEDFALEDMNELRANIIRENYGDVRNIAIKKLTVAWNVLTPHRAALADTMIKAAVETSASEVEEIQEFAVDVYFQMIKSEFESSNNMNSVETHTIDQIDQLTAKYSNKENVINRYLDFFRIRVKKKLDNGTNQKLKKMGNTFLSDIERLYNYLVQLKKLPNTAKYEDERTAATLKLLQYLNSSGKNELYNRYIHHLALMHQTLSNHICAAICFKSHADRLGWSDNILKEEPLVGLSKDYEWKRHVNLCELSHKHFMLGEAWEMGVNVCQELAKAYQDEIFDLKALSSILEKQSHLWKLISNQDRVFHSSYLVRFYGTFNQPKLYGDNIDNKSFIYRSGNGKNPESIRDFTQRIKNKYENAKIINSASSINYDPNESKENIIQITTLTPSSIEELNGGIFKWEQEKYLKAPLRLRKYYRENETSVYFYTNAVQKKKNKKDNEFRSLWITKTFIVCQDEIPSMRRRIPVISEKIVEYTPFQTAINQIADKNGEVVKIIEKLENDPTKSTNAISMNLNGILDAAVMGGINKYREAFFDGTYLSEYPAETKLVSKFVNTLKKQMLIAKNGLDCYDKYSIDALQPHVDHLKACYKKQMIALSEFYKETQKYIDQ